ncbi:unnamed protein product [Strongylus vulgaris]|uniref:Uncharacterized protein n=1 Tax=Strongylus vulgaris TaxID=40348 RepID=A0A3P7K903_STRVU|nr:unnamed protein product [Strongylus vulgaris]
MPNTALLKEKLLSIELENDDKDFEDIIYTSERRSHDSGSTPSIDSRSSDGGERVVFDFPFDAGKEEHKQINEHSEQLPDLQNRRKSIHDILELRSSIDHSLIKPPKLQKQKSKRSVSTSSNKEESDFEHLAELEDEPQVKLSDS